MKIHLLSDLHLEGANYKHPFPEADVCILAGDICVASGMGQEYIRKFFQKISLTYQRSYYVPGNHEYYHSLYGPDHGASFTRKHINTFLGDRSIAHHLKAWGIDNIKFMNRDAEVYNGIKFIGATLWTDYFKNDPLEKMKAIECMNDFGLIGGFTPDKAYDEHMQSRHFIANELCNEKELQKVVITHHGPTLESIHRVFRDPMNGYLNASFTSDLSEFFGMPESPTHWFHGHTHESLDYKCGDTRVVTNPRGYRGEFQHDPFNPELVIEV